MAKDNTKRFSSKVEDYVKYRPGYPKEIIDALQKNYQLTSDKIIADIGAGTGISTKLFLDAQYKVFAIEPNKEMREKAVDLLRGYSALTVLDGTAENTKLQTDSIDAIVSGQAFHWFDVEKTKTEFKRILKKNGLVILIWNERNTNSDFEKKYDQLIIEHAKDYVQVDHRNIDEKSMAAFYAPHHFELLLFKNRQAFDLNGLEGRLLSSSYMPGKNEDGYDDMHKDLQELFDRYNENGSITINYETKVYIGTLN